MVLSVLVKGRARWSAAVFALGAIAAGPPAGAEPPQEWERPRQEISAAWRVHREALSQGQFDVGKRELDRIGEIRNRYGLESLQAVSAGLLREISEFGLDPEQAEVHLGYAGKFSPGLTAADAHYCSLSGIATGRLETLRRCLSALAKEWRGPDGRLRILTNAAFAFLTLLAALSLIFGIHLVQRYGAALLHRFRHALRGAHPLGLACAAGLLLLAGWMALGWLGAALLFYLGFWRHLERGERIVAVSLLAAAAAVPLLLYFPALRLRFDREVGALLAQPADGILLARQGERLRAWVAEHPGDSGALFRLARIEMRAQRFDEARRILTRLTELRPDWHKPLVNLAAIDYREKETAAATSRLKKAVTLAPQSLRARFNLGKIYYEQTRLEEGRFEHSKAREIDPAQFAAFQQMEPPAGGEWHFLEEELSAAEIGQRVWPLTAEATDLRDRLHRALFPMLPVPAYWILLGLVAALGFAWDRVRSATRLPRACGKCGRPSCALCDPSVQHEPVCSQCYHLFVRLEAVDPEARRRKEAAVARYRVVREAAERWSGALLPGFHRLARGQAVSGMLILSALAALFLCAIGGSGPLRNPFRLPDAPGMPIPWVCGALLLAAYGITLWDALRR